MTRLELEHIIRAAGRIVNERDIVVIGSQAILGQFPTAPPTLRRSMEADVFPKTTPELADDIDAAIGANSPFQREFGIYAHGVSPETARLPESWQSRLVTIDNENTNGYRGLCLEIHDLVLSKYAASRLKDLEFNAEAIRHGLVERAELFKRLTSMNLPDERAGLIRALISRDFRAAGRPE